MAGFAERYLIRVHQLAALLEQLPRDAWLRPNRLGNILVYRGDVPPCANSYLGLIETGEEELTLDPDTPDEAWAEILPEIEERYRTDWQPIAAEMGLANWEQARLTTDAATEDDE